MRTAFVFEGARMQKKKKQKQKQTGSIEILALLSQFTSTILLWLSLSYYN